MFKAKPYKKVGKDMWEVYIPYPPKHATHAVLTCFNDTYDNGSPKTATVPIQDFGVFKGVSGEFHYVRMDNRKKLKETYEGKWYWNGKNVPEIYSLIDQDEK